MRRKCYGLPVRLPYIVMTCARMFGIKRFCYYPLCRICVHSDIVSVHDSPQKVFIHNYPFEASSDSLSLVLKRFGDVKDISHRRWLHMKDIFDGVRVVTMIRDKPIPRNLDVDGFHVKVSY